jgi:hypothetical protein
MSDTMRALIGKIMKIGVQEDSLTEVEVKSYIFAVLQPMAIQAAEIEKQQTIFDLIAIITRYLNAGKTNE